MRNIFGRFLTSLFNTPGRVTEPLRKVEFTALSMSVQHLTARPFSIASVEQVRIDANEGWMALANIIRTAPCAPSDIDMAADISNLMHDIARRITEAPDKNHVLLPQKSLNSILENKNFIGEMAKCYVQHGSPLTGSGHYARKWDDGVVTSLFEAGSKKASIGAGRENARLIEEFIENLDLLVATPEPIKAKTPAYHRALMPGRYRRHNPR